MVLPTLENNNNIFDSMRDQFFSEGDPRCCDPLKYSLKWILVLLFFPKREKAASTLTDCYEQEIGEGTSTEDHRPDVCRLEPPEQLRKVLLRPGPGRSRCPPSLVLKEHLHGLKTNSLFLKLS